MEHFDDPRILTSGHQFCLKCVKDIADHHPQRHVKCPICCDVTVPKNDDVTTLAKVWQFHHIQEAIFDNRLRRHWVRNAANVR